MSKRRELQTKKRKIIRKIIIFLITISILFYLILKISFFLSEPLHVALNPTDLSVFTTNKQDSVNKFDIEIQNFRLCKAQCELILHDIGMGESKQLTIINARYKKEIETNITFTAPEKGTGLLPYRVEVKCFNINTIFCPSSQEVYSDSTFVTVHYNLTNGSLDSKQKLSSQIPELVDKIDWAYQHIKYAKKIDEQNLSFNGITCTNLDINNYQERFDNLLMDVIDIQSLWNTEEYEKINPKNTIESINRINNELNNSENKIINDILIFNKAAIVSTELKESSKTLNNAYYFYSITNKAYPSSNNLIQLSNIEKIQIQYEESDIDETVSDLEKKLIELKRTADKIISNYSVDNTTQLNRSNSVNIKFKKYLWANYSEYTNWQDLCMDMNNTYGQIIKHNQDVKPLDTNLTIEGKNISDAENLSRWYLNKIDTQKNRNISSLVSILPYITIPSDDLLGEKNMVCSISEDYIPFLDITEFQKISLPQYDSANLKIQFVEPKPSCCFYAECDPCTTNKTLNPIIFVHGHLVNKDASPEKSQFAFAKIMESIEEYGYINSGDLDITQPTQSFQKGEWGHYNKPTMSSVSYYYISYVDLGINTVQIQKTERIENYALRLNSYIDRVLYRTGAKKVNIVAYSMGGLVSREYMTIFGTEKVDIFITLGTPNKGVIGSVDKYCNIIGSADECGDMSADSLFIKQLNAHLVLPEHTYTIGGSGCDMDGATGDGIVTINSSMLPNTTHFTIKGKCTDILKTEMHGDMLDPDKYPAIPKIITNILQNSS